MKAAGRRSEARNRETQTGTLIADQRANLAKYLLAGWELAQQPGVQSLAELPAHPGDTRLFVEAEKFDRGNANRDFDNYGKGIGVIHTVTVPTFAEWDINVTKAGNYQIEMRYAAMQSRPDQLLAERQGCSTSSAAGNVTGSWNPDGQKWEVQGVYSLAAGKNTIRIENNGDIPHIDKLMLVAGGSRKWAGTANLFAVWIRSPKPEHLIRRLFRYGRRACAWRRTIPLWARSCAMPTAC